MKEESRMEGADKPKKKPSPRRGEAHAPNPSVNRQDRPRILEKRIRAMRRRGAKSPLSRRLDAKLRNYEGQLNAMKGGL
jgi:hypothetical protein